MLKTPDRWNVITLIAEGQPPIRKVLGVWHGGYLSGDSWQLSSGIEDIRDRGKFFDIRNVSGSIYRCYKDGQGLNWYGMSVLESFKQRWLFVEIDKL